MKNVVIIAGGAGFIGSNLVKKLLEADNIVYVIDNFCRGSSENLSIFKDNSFLYVKQANLSVRDEVMDAFNHASSLGAIGDVWHLAANSDIPAGVENIDVDYRDTFLTTLEILRAMKFFKISNFHFASSSAVYGDMGSTILHEKLGPLLPISNYGAMKLSSEALASASAESFLSQINLFRFPNVVGTPATHGVILDFIKKLSDNKLVLNVLGNGTQQKAYLHVSDLISAMLFVVNRKLRNKIELLNIGPIDNGVTVKWIAECVVSRVSPNAQILFGSGNRGWVGDVPKFSYSTDLIQSYGWKPSMNSEEAVLLSVDQISTQLGF